MLGRLSGLAKEKRGKDKSPVRPKRRNVEGSELGTHRLYVGVPQFIKSGGVIRVSVYRRSSSRSIDGIGSRELVTQSDRTVIVEMKPTDKSRLERKPNNKIGGQLGFGTNVIE